MYEEIFPKPDLIFFPDQLLFLKDQKWFEIPVFELFFHFISISQKNHIADFSFPSTTPRATAASPPMESISCFKILAAPNFTFPT